MAQPMVYDQFDREAVKYLPYVVSTSSPNDGSYKTTAVTDQASFYANPTGSTWNAPGVVSTPYPVSVTAFENSPLSRTLEQGFAGDNWQLTGATGPISPGHTVKMLYASNDASSLTNGDGYWAQLYTVTYSYPTGSYDYRNSLANSSAYPANTLYVTVIKNENWSVSQSDTTLNTTQEYKDLFGRVVLKRTFNYTTARQVLSTYYVYDEYGNLTYVLPPQASPDTGNITQAVLDNLCYQYRYDGRGRMIYKKIPGKGWQFMVYNNLNQVIATQDSAQRMKVPQQLLYTKYDAQGRVIITGYYKTSDNTPGVDDRVTLQSAANAQTTLWETKLATGSYTSATIPTTGGTALATNYYDDYKIAALPATYTLTTGVSAMTRGLLTCSKVAIVATPSDILWKVNYYDDLGRATNSYAQHYLGGHAGLNTNNYDQITTTYNFTNAPTTTTRQHNNTTATPLVTITNTYYYDQVGRKLSSWEQITNGGATAGPKTLVSKVDYNQIGQVTDKHLHSTDSVNYLQTIAYTYNERGWLTYSSAPLFAMQLQYNTGATKAWNGDVMYQYWGTPGNLANHYTYIYDNLDRLTAGVNPVSNNKENGIAYDLNGNITALNRYQNNAQIDQLSYTYTNAAGNYTNQLQTVTDNSGSNAGLVNGATAYTYDGNGNMLSAANSANNMQNKSFTYNMFNMPIVATMPVGTAIYTYDGNSEKLEKVAVISGATTITDYIGGIQYNGNGSTDTLSFIPTEEGRALHNGTTYDYQYYLYDQLGNTRITFNSKTAIAKTIQQDDYYPFGLEISQSSLPLSPKNEYLYNKKELQEELTEYDYGARFYDPTIARWIVSDPMSEKYCSYSNYVYAVDNPILFVDPDGASVVPTDGGYIFTFDDAVSAFNLFLNKVHQNVYLAITRNKRFQHQTDRDRSMSGQWNVFGVSSFEQGVDVLNTIASVSNYSLDNLVIETHGGLNASGSESIKINDYNDNDISSKNFITNNDLMLANGKIPNAKLEHNKSTAEKLAMLKQLTDKITDGGRLIFASCITGVGQAGKDFGENLSEFTGDRLNIFLAKDFINPGWYKDEVDQSLGVWFSREFNARWLQTNPNRSQVDVKSITLSAVAGTPPVTINHKQ